MITDQIIFEKKLPLGKLTTYKEKPLLELLTVNRQIHSNKVVTCDSLNEDADGIVVFDLEQSFNLSVITADCLPVVLVGELGVGLVHAGWKGLATGILNHQLIKELKPTYAFIGPSIRSCCFEVTSEFKDNFRNSKNFIENGSTISFDLVAEAKNILRITYKNISIEEANICTCCNKKFHSYRRDKTLSRNWNVFSI